MASIARGRLVGRLSSTILRSRHSSIPRNNRCWHDVASPGRLGDPNPDASIPSILRNYLRLLHDRPLATTSITATAAAATGDALAQLEAYLGVRTKFDAWIAGNQYTGPTSPPRMQAEAIRASVPKLQQNATIEYGPLRTLRFSILAGALPGGLGELWFRNFLLVHMPGWTYEVALRTAFDLALFAPPALGVAVGGTALLTTGGDFAYAAHKLRYDWAHSLGRMWALWGCGAMASYLLVPTPWQPPFSALLGVCWTYHVSTRVHLPTETRGFAVDHTPERVGEYLLQEAHHAVRR